MKKNLHFILIFFCFIFLFSCAKEDKRQEDIEKDDLMFFTCYAPGADSKTQIGGRNETNDGTQIDWTLNDAINIFYNNGSYRFVASDNSDFADSNPDKGRVAKFYGTIDNVGYVADDLDLKNVVALYPYDANANCNPNTKVVYNLSVPTLQVATAAGGNFDPTALLSIGKPDDPNNPTKLFFKNICSVIEFTVCHDDVRYVKLASNRGGAGFAPLAGDNMTVSLQTGDPIVTSFSNTEDPKYEILISPPYGTSFKQDTKYYAVVLPGVHGYGVTLTEKTPTGEYSKTTTNRVEFKRSHMKKAHNFAQGLTIKNYTYEDLSLTRINPSNGQFEKNLSTRETANTYVIPGVGFYKIPLVYGNAIKGGVANTYAYNPGPLATETDGYFLQTFINHKGEDQAETGIGKITHPWIEDNGINITKAEIEWQDGQLLVLSNIVNVVTESDGKYLTFEVYDFVKGNAVIVVRDDNNQIAWSWQLWCYDDNLTSVEQNNFGTDGTNGITYKFMPVNLGWDGPVDLSQVDNILKYTSPTYQWGRKDPIPAFYFPANPDPSATNTFKPRYSKEYNFNTKMLGANYQNINHNRDEYIWLVKNNILAGDIKTPATFRIASSSLPGPYRNPPTNEGADGSFALEQMIGSRFINLWSALETNRNVSKQSINNVKTIYDPSPRGYRVPSSNAFTGLVKNGLNVDTLIHSTDTEPNKHALVNTPLLGPGNINLSFKFYKGMQLSNNQYNFESGNLYLTSGSHRFYGSGLKHISSLYHSNYFWTAGAAPSTKTEDRGEKMNPIIPAFTVYPYAYACEVRQSPSSNTDYDVRPFIQPHRMSGANIRCIEDIYYTSPETYPIDFSVNGLPAQLTSSIDIMNNITFTPSNATNKVVIYSMNQNVVSTKPGSTILTPGNSGTTKIIVQSGLITKQYTISVP